MYTNTYSVSLFLYFHLLLSVLDYLECSKQSVFVCQVRNLVHPKLLPVFLIWLFLKQSILAINSYLGDKLQINHREKYGTLKSEHDDLFSVFLQIVQRVAITLGHRLEGKIPVNPWKLCAGTHGRTIQGRRLQIFQWHHSEYLETGWINHFKMFMSFIFLYYNTLIIL